MKFLILITVLFSHISCAVPTIVKPTDIEDPILKTKVNATLITCGEIKNCIKEAEKVVPIKPLRLIAFSRQNNLYNMTYSLDPRPIPPVAPRMHPTAEWSEYTAALNFILMGQKRICGTKVKSCFMQCNDKNKKKPNYKECKLNEKACAPAAVAGYAKCFNNCRTKMIEAKTCTFDKKMTLDGRGVELDNGDILEFNAADIKAKRDAKYLQKAIANNQVSLETLNKINKENARIAKEKLRIANQKSMEKSIVRFPKALLIFLK